MEHPVSKDRLCFLGQGETVAEAVNDGLKTMALPFRPRDGKSTSAPSVAVTKADGRAVLTTLKEFEAAGAPAPTETEDLGDLFG